MSGAQGSPRPEPGQSLPPQALILTREDLRRYADASGDHNPIHLDDDVARQFGLEDGVIAHGMLVMGRMATYVQSTMGGSSPTSFRVRFRSPVRQGIPLVMTGHVVSVDAETVVVQVAVAARAGGAPAVTGTWTGRLGSSQRVE